MPNIMDRMKKTTIPHDLYEIEIRLITEMLGTVPKDENIRRDYIVSKAPDPKLQAEEMETGPTYEDLDKKGFTGFNTDDEGLFVYDYHIKGFLKEAADNLKGVKVDGPLGIKNAKSKIDNFVFVGPRRIRIVDTNGNPIQNPAYRLERPLRAMTAQGPRVSLAASDVVLDDARLLFEVLVLPSEFKEDHIRMILDYGVLKGLGQWRNGGYGRFIVESFKKVKSVK